MTSPALLQGARRQHGHQPPSYRRTSVFSVMEAKREETRARRFATLLECSARGERIPLLRRD